MRIGRGFFTLPLAAIVLEPMHLALWLLLLVILDGAAQVELGLSPTILRATGYFLSGADKLRAVREVAGDDEAPRAPNLKALAELVATGRLIYLILSLLAIPIVFGIATFSSWTFLSSGGFAWDLWLALGITVLLVIIRLQTVLWSSMLRGHGHVAAYNRVEGNVHLVITVLQIVALLVAPSVLTLLAAQFLGWLVLWLWAAARCKRCLLDEGVDLRQTRPSADMARQLWSPTWRLAVTMLGTFLILNGPSFLVGQLASAETAAAYLLCMRLLFINRGIAGAFILAEMPAAVRMSVRQEFGPLREFTAKRIAASSALFLLGLVLLLALGNPVLHLAGAKSHLLPFVPLALLGVSILVLGHMADHVQIFITSNRIPFWQVFAIGGIATTVLSGLLIPYMQVWSLVWVRLAVTIVGVGWYPVLVNLDYLDWRWRDYWRDMPLAGVKLVRSRLSTWIR
jgi:O-antigen/teichoic acid export membrane protein